VSSVESYTCPMWEAFTFLFATMPIVIIVFKAFQSVQIVHCAKRHGVKKVTLIKGKGLTI